MGREPLTSHHLGCEHLSREALTSHHLITTKKTIRQKANGFDLLKMILF